MTPIAVLPWCGPKLPSVRITSRRIGRRGYGSSGPGEGDRTARSALRVDRNPVPRLCRTLLDATPRDGRLAEVRSPVAALEQGGERRRLHRPREQVALAELAAEGSQRAQLVGPLDSLGDDLETQRLAELDDHANEDRPLAVGAEAVHEGAIDLEHVDGEAVQVAQRRVARPEVVDRQPDAVAPQRPERLDG